MYEDPRYNTYTYSINLTYKICFHDNILYKYVIKYRRPNFNVIKIPQFYDLNTLDVIVIKIPQFYFYVVITQSQHIFSV